MEEPIRITLTEFRTNIQKYLGIAAGGRPVIIMSYGKDRAVLGPPPQEKDDDSKS